MIVAKEPLMTYDQSNFNSRRRIMRKSLTIISVFVILAAASSFAYAQAPAVQVVFDQNYVQQTKVCNLGTIDSAYVVAFNFNTWIVGIEYAVSYPTGIAWLGDQQIPITTLGDTPSGITEVWQLPLNGFAPMRLAKINYFCSMCQDDSPIVVTAHPVSGALRATRYPDLAFVYAIGMTSIFCPNLIPVQNSTWGEVKALYKQ